MKSTVSLAGRGGLGDRNWSSAAHTKHLKDNVIKDIPSYPPIVRPILSVMSLCGRSVEFQSGGLQSG